MKNLREYLRPTSIEEAVRLKRELDEAAVYLAGGSDLMVHRPSRVQRAIDIRYSGMGYSGEDGDAFVMGGAALLCDAEVSMSSVAGGMLRQAMRETAPWLIRNAATVAGNIANASPAADSVPALVVLDAMLHIYNGEETALPVMSVVTGPHRTTLGNGLIREIRISRDAARRQGAFIKLARSKSDIAQVNVAVAFQRDGDVLRDVRIALGAVAPTVVRARSAERVLEGRVASPEALHHVQNLVADDISPISDWRASAEYRSRMSGVLVRRALEEALSRPLEDRLREA